MASSPDPDYVLRGSDSALTSLAYFSDSSQCDSLLSGNASGHIHTWCVRSRRPLSVTEAHPGSSVLRVEQLGTDEMVTHGRGSCVRVWKNPGSGWIPRDAFPCDSLSFCAAVMMRLGGATVIALPGHDQSQVDIVSTDTRRTICRLSPSKTSPPRGMCMYMKAIDAQREQSMLLVAYESGSIALWDIRQARELSELQCHTDSVMSFDYGVGRNLGVSGSVDTVLKTWRLNEQHCIVSVKDIEIKNPGVSSVNIRGDGKLFAAGCWDSRLRIFSAKNLRPLAILCQHTGSIHCLAFTADNTLAAGSNDCTISVWSLYK